MLYVVHPGGEGGEKVYPTSELFTKLVNKNVIKHQKCLPSPKNFHNSYIPSLPKFGKNPMDPPPRFSNRVQLWCHGNCNKNCLGSFQVLWNKNCNIKS